MHFSRALFPGAALLLLLTAPGCGRDGPEVIPVTGTLTYQGKPVPNALLNFLPEFGRQSWAQTDAEGKFKVNYDKDRDGAVVGKHKVWIEFRPSSDADKEAAILGKAPALSKDMKAFFEKYNYENSKLEVQVDSSSRELELNLD